MESGGKKADAVADDRISMLPDDILHHILHFLDTRSAARSSVLSKRWRGQWAYSPTFDLEIEQTPIATFGDRVATCVKGALMRRKSPASIKFRIRTPHDCSLPESSSISVRDNESIQRVFDQSIASCMRSPGVQELSLIFGHAFGLGWHYILPADVICSANLRVLKLKSCEISNVGTLVLANVETLSLKDVKAPENVICPLISSCVNVKRLKLSSCHLVGSIDVCLGELREIVLGKSSLTNVTIDAPKLQFAQSYTQIRKDYRLCLKNSADLQHAIIGYHPRNCYRSCQESIGYHARSSYRRRQKPKGPTIIRWTIVAEFKNLVLSFGMAKCLELRSYTIPRISLNTFENCPPLFGVRKLVITLLSCNSSAVAMLRLFPNLEHFSSECKDTDGIFPHDKYRAFYEESLEGVSVHCLANSLRTIELSNLDDSPIQAKLPEFLVRNAMVLEKMHIINSSGNYLYHCNLRRFLRENRACQSAEIVYS